MRVEHIPENLTSIDNFKGRVKCEKVNGEGRHKNKVNIRLAICEEMDKDSLIFTLDRSLNY